MRVEPELRKMFLAEESGPELDSETFYKNAIKFIHGGSVCCFFFFFFFLNHKSDLMGNVFFFLRVLLFCVFLRRCV